MNPRYISRPLRGALSVAVLSVITACAGEGIPPTGVEPATGAFGERSAASVAASSGSLQLVSTTPAGAAARSGSTTCQLSADGTLLLFASDASNLVNGDTNGASDLFLRNLTTGITTRVTTGSTSAQLATGGHCTGTTMTPDGRLVAFNTGTAGGTVFVKNTQTGALTQASPAIGSIPQVTGFFGGVLSDDGRSVVFKTVPAQVYRGAYQWDNVVPARLMLRDLNTGSLITLPTDNGNAANGEVQGSRFAISPDGTRVAFASSSSTLVSGDTNGRADLFVLDLSNNTVTLASSTSAGIPATGGGTYWTPTFVSNTQLSFGTGSVSSLGDRGFYLKDLNSGALTLVLRDTDGGSTAVLSGDARFVVFSSNYSGFNARVFMRDLSTGVHTVVSANSSGTASNGSSTGAVISRNGSRVAFGSNASNLVTPRPPSGVFQIYVKSLAAGVTLAP